jgi:hypothetical protein
LDDLHAHLVEFDDRLHHTDGLLEGAVVIVLGESILREEMLLDDFSGLNIEKERLGFVELIDISYL